MDYVPVKYVLAIKTLKTIGLTMYNFKGGIHWALS